MRKFKVRRVGQNKIVEEVVMTEQDIIDQHWEFWSRKHGEMYGVLHPDINRENCLRDWCSSHSVIEIKE